MKENQYICRNHLDCYTQKSCIHAKPHKIEGYKNHNCNRELSLLCGGICIPYTEEDSASKKP